MNGNKKKINFIPSPFPAVTAYEEELVREWNENMSAAVSAVLKHIAELTASAIKEKGEENDI